MSSPLPPYVIVSDHRRHHQRHVSEEIHSIQNFLSKESSLLPIRSSSNPVGNNNSSFSHRVVPYPASSSTNLHHHHHSPNLNYSIPQSASYSATTTGHYPHHSSIMTHRRTNSDECISPRDTNNIMSDGYVRRRSSSNNSSLLSQSQYKDVHHRGKASATTAGSYNTNYNAVSFVTGYGAAAHHYTSAPSSPASASFNTSTPSSPSSSAMDIAGTANGKFNCDKCPATFSRTHDLIRHVKTHTQQKPHVCIYCGRGVSALL